MCPHSRLPVVFGFSSGQISFVFRYEEVLFCEAQSFNGNFVLRNENIFAFQLTANIGFLEGRRSFQASRKMSSWADDIVSVKIIIGRFV